MPSVTHMLITNPPGNEGDIVLNEYKNILYRAKNIEWIGCLSATSVYGDHQGAWVDENSKLKPSSERGKRRMLAENQWLDFAKNNKANIFRLAGIYGPKRNALESIRNFKARSIFKKGQVFSRIHVEDIAQIIKASMTNLTKSEIYNLADNYPCPGYEVNDFAARLLNVEPPELIDYNKAELSPMAHEFYADNKRASNRKITESLKIKLIYPTYKEGLTALYESNFSRNSKLNN
jgi:nucleoside-diphosphate-sugar epimerase